MDDEVFAEVMTMFDESPVDEAATAAADDAESTVESETPNEEPVESGAEGTPEETAEEPAQPEQPAPDWRSHPEAQEALRKAQALEIVQQAIAAKQAQEAQQRFQTDLTDLADGDPERQTKLAQMLQLVQAPLHQQLTQTAQEAHHAGKAATAVLNAAKALLPEAQYAQLLDQARGLMQYEGPEVIERMALAGKQQTERERALAKQIADLKKQLAATQTVAGRTANGADAVDGGRGSSVPTDLNQRFDEAKSMADVFAMMGL